jgi:hypothetical protein
MGWQRSGKPYGCGREGLCSTGKKLVLSRECPVVHQQFFRLFFLGRVSVRYNFNWILGKSQGLNAWQGYAL